MKSLPALSEARPPGRRNPYRKTSVIIRPHLLTSTLLMMSMNAVLRPQGAAGFLLAMSTLNIVEPVEPLRPLRVRMSREFYVYMEEGRLHCSPAAVKADIGFRAISYTSDRWVRCAEGRYDGDRHLSDADGIVDGVNIHKGTQCSRRQEQLITHGQVASIGNGVHIPSGMAVRVSMVEVLVRTIRFPNCTMVIHLLTGVVFGDCFPISDCIVPCPPLSALRYRQSKDAPPRRQDCASPIPRVSHVFWKLYLVALSLCIAKSLIWQCPVVKSKESKSTFDSLPCAGCQGVLLFAKSSVLGTWSPLLS